MVPSGPFMRSAQWRPTMSVTPPAENGIISLIGRSGNFACADAPYGNAVADRAPKPT